MNETNIRTGVIKTINKNTIILEMKDTQDLLIWPISEDALKAYREEQEVNLGIAPSDSITRNEPTQNDNNEERRKLLELLVN